MVFIPLILAIAGTAIAAYGAVQQGNVASANAKSQSNAMRFNATVADQNATQASQQASSRELALRAHTAQVLGNQRAAIAESGAGFGGTYQNVENQSAVNAEMDALNTRYTGVIQNRSFGLQEDQDIFQSNIARENASADQQAGYVGAASALLSGASKAYGAGSFGGGSGGAGY